ncbi:Ger(x)C family spore germination protein [Paenibacillus provencensis]|uniref:Ger(X)C family spore germination protein n=1 Tax=Paenibacillus provencensis TaxID=441151 RepID=A0ABW3Q3A9_9BACL|nr:Ger(x)C family spore germination protein [Paenibacillus sp. MER 78]MCM3128395.1 Ger(x)C family spore germination protein [Paenibacillus sp. MER 78]
MNRLSKAIVIVLLCTLVTGCWDRREINDIAFVVGTALDKEEDKYRVTLQITIPGMLAGSNGGSGGGGGNKNPWFLKSNVSETVRGVILKEQTSTSRKLYFSHRRSLLFGEGLAREGIAEALDSIGRLPENRLSALPVVTEGNAYEVLNGEPTIEQYPGEVVRELVFSYLSKPWTLKTVVNLMLEDGIDPIMPLVETVNSVPEKIDKPHKNIGIGGVAVFHDDKLTGIIKKQDTHGILVAMDQARTLELPITVPRGEGKVFFLIRANHTKIKPIVNGEDIHFHIYTGGRMSMTTNESNYDTNNEGNIMELERKMNKLMKEKISHDLKLLQNYKSDVLGLGRIIRTEKPQVWSKIRDRWYEIYPNITFDVEAEYRLENNGAATSPFAVKKEDIER